MQDLRFTFDQDAKNYDKSRPAYSRLLFEDIIKYATISSKSNILEIGAGTGLATRPFLLCGAHLTALEPGKNMYRYLLNKYDDFSKLKVENSTFEDYNCDDQYDLIYSATAFHWIPAKIAYPKTQRLLKPGGTLALFWNRPFVSRHDDPCHCAIAEVYSKYLPNGRRPVEDNTELYQKIKDTINDYGYSNVQCKLYHGDRLTIYDTIDLYLAKK